MDFGMERMKNMQTRAFVVAVSMLCAMPAITMAQDGAAAVQSEMAPKASSAQINDLSVLGDRLVAVGEKGIIIMSSDGKTWKQAATPVDILLNAVFFTDEKHGWAVGHDATIIHTADGGETWTLQNWNASDNRPFMDVLFLDAQRGFAVGAYGLFKTTEDGGSTWTDFSDPAFEQGPHLNALNRLGDGTLVLVGESGLSATSPDGKSWSVHPTGYEGSLFSVIPRGEKGAMAVGMRGTMMEAADMSCPAWQKVETETDKSLFGLLDLGNGKVAVGGNGGALRVLAPGAKPLPIVPPSEAGVSQATAIGGLALWQDRVFALTDRGVKTVLLNP